MPWCLILHRNNFSSGDEHLQGTEQYKFSLVVLIKHNEYILSSSLGLHADHIHLATTAELSVQNRSNSLSCLAILAPSYLYLQLRDSRSQEIHARQTYFGVSGFGCLVMFWSLEL
jgi:hypothetical protein